MVVRGRIAHGVAALVFLPAAVLLAVGATRAPPGAPAWECGAVLGLLGVLAVLALCILPLRVRGRFVPRLPLHLHRWLGWLAPALAAAHVVVAVLADPLVLRYLRPSLPWYQLAGALGLVLLLALALLAEMPPRSIGPVRRGYRPLHLSLCVLTVALLSIHVLTSGHYAAVLALRPGVRAATLALREPLLPGGAPLPLAFPHQRHATINCIACHHNMVDHSGTDTCLSCHRSGRADLRHGAEARLHDFCLACHRTRPRGARHGPVAGCTGCHHRESG